MQTGLSSCDHETLTGAVDVFLAQENFGVREFLRLGIIVPGASDAVADVKTLGVFALHLLSGGGYLTKRVVARRAR